MTKSKRILALIMAFIMMMGVCTTAFAKTKDANAYKTNPEKYLNSISKITLTAEDGATQILDMLDDLLKETNLKMDNYMLVDNTAARLGITINLTSIDSALKDVYNLVKGLGGDEDCLDKVLTTRKIFGISMGGVIASLLKTIQTGDIKNLNVSALGDQNSASRTCRNWPEVSGQTGSSDIAVLKMLTQFLSDNREILKKVATSKLDFGTFDDTIKGINDTVKSLLTDFTGFLADTLYGVLWDKDADAAPGDFSYDTYIQKLVDWALIEGTGEAADNGGKSVLGTNFSALLPAMATSGNGKGADILTQGVYDLVNNAVQALLSGTVSDLLKNLLINLLNVDTNANDGLGNEDALDNIIISSGVPAIIDLLIANGAPAFEFSENAKKYPVPMIEELLDYLFNGNGLIGTFITLEKGKIGLTDAFMSLINDLARMLPNLLPNFVEGLTLDFDIDFAQKAPADETRGVIYLTYEGEEIYLDASSNTYFYMPEDKSQDMSEDKVVNTTDSKQDGYRNPTFIRYKYAYSNDEVFGAILKLVLNSVIDGCYFPEWAKTVPEVGAYGLASLASRYLPENDYFDRLDAYHAEQIGESYTPRGGASAVTALPYTEEITLSMDNGGSTTVTIPRAAADIGASIGAYFLNGVFPVADGLASGYGTNSFETNTTFETFAFEFLFWGVRKYMPAFVGYFNQTDNKFENTNDYTGFSSAWQTVFNTAWNSFSSKIDTYGGSSHDVSNIPASEMRSVLFDLIDNTLFKIFPSNFLPDWLDTFSSASEALIYYWLGDSVANLDLQQLFSLLQANSTGELNESLRTVLLRIIDRALGMLFGGNAVLPTASETSNRIVYNENISITTFDALLANGDNLGTFISMLLYELNIYLKPLANTLLPLFSTTAIKNAAYYDKDGNYNNYIGNNTITVDNLADYVEKLDSDQNYKLYSGDKNFTSKTKAEEAAKAFGYTDYNADEHKTTVSGVTRYVVTFPESYSVLSTAEVAKKYAEELTGSTFDVRSKRDGTETSYYLYEKIDYRTTSADENVSYTYKDDGNTVDTTIYTYTNFDTAKILQTESGSYRTGSKGEVQYETDKYKAVYTEDYSTGANGVYMRLSSSLSDASDYVNDFHTYAEQTLPNAYGDWLMYFVRMQLFTESLYDKNDDGTFSAITDTNPSTPSSPYPFTATSGYSTKQSYAGDTNYNFADTANEQAVLAALEYAEVAENDVTLDPFDAEDVVRLAISSLSFDITKNSSGGYNTGSIQWTDLTADQKSQITTLCNNLGLTYNDDGENSTITRKAFALFTSTMNGKTVFGNYCTYTTNDNGEITAVATTTSVPLTPYTFKKTHSTGDTTENNGAEQQIWESYVDFAKDSDGYTEGLRNHYDDISWRAANLENNSNSTPDLTTLKWAVSYTKAAYNPYSLGVNKQINNQDATKTMPIYSSSTFTNFQRAYEYAVQLIAKKTDIRQSLVTVAYQKLMETYYNLEEYSGLADWEKYKKSLTDAEEALNSDLGLNADGTVKDAENGYTLETLTNLKAAYDTALNYYNTNIESLDSDSQETVDNKRDDLQSVIDALKFPDGVSPDIKVKSTYEGTLKTNPIEKTSATSVQYGFITGLTEGTGFTKAIADEAIQVYGFKVGTGSNQAIPSETSRGAGTGSKYTLRNDKGSVVVYTAVIMGDLNGDTRIDSNDKLILQSYLADKTTNTMENYELVASDVDYNGDVDLDDIAKIKAHYTYKDQTGASGTTIDPEISQTNTITINTQSNTTNG